MEHSDEVVQQLAVAKYALSVGDTARAIDAVDDALGLARHMLSKLLDVVSPPQLPTQPGSLVRQTPAGGDEGAAGHDGVVPPPPRTPSD